MDSSHREIAVRSKEADLPRAKIAAVQATA